MPYIIDNITADTINVTETLKINGEEILPGLQTVSVDNVTIVGNGTTLSPLTAVTPTAPYKVYTALLTQTGSTAPVATVLENTLEVDITYSYSNTGVYFINSSENIFEQNNFGVITGAGNSSALASLWVYYNSQSQLYLEVYDLGNVGGGFNLQNGILTNQFIEIRVYN